MVIADVIQERREVLEVMEEHLINNANAPGTQSNYETRKNRYFEFCDFNNIKPFPATEFKISKFAVYLSDLVKTVETVKRYCATICDESELRGYRPVRRGLKFHRTVAGIRRKLHHKPKQAAPMTPELLEKICDVVNTESDKETVVFTSMLTGFNLTLRKSNIVPLKRMHDSIHNISRQDVRYGKGVMVFTIDWSKTNQHQQQVDTPPLIANKHSKICPVKWILQMMNRIPAKPQHNLFSFVKKGLLVPITYNDLMSNMRRWLKLIGKDASKYSSHSLRRGSTTLGHKRQIDGKTLQVMGSWKSDCYKSYIDVDMETRVKAWYQFNNKK